MGVTVRDLNETQELQQIPKLLLLVYGILNENILNDKEFYLYLKRYISSKIDKGEKNADWEYYGLKDTLIKEITDENKKFEEVKQVVNERNSFGEAWNEYRTKLKGKLW